MKTDSPPLAVLPLCLALVISGGACALSSSAPAGGTGATGGSFDAGADGVRADASNGSGGSVGFGSGGAPGAGGAIASSGGRTGTGGASAGLGGAGVAGCFIRLTVLSPLESGPNTRLRIKASVSNPGARAPIWTWHVQFANAIGDVPTTKINDDPSATESIVDFPIKNPGQYAVQVRVDTGLACPVWDQVLTVRPPGMSSFLFRVTPPASAGLGVLSQEQRIELGPTGPSTTFLNLGVGTRVSVAANDPTGRYIPAYVRVSGLSSGVTVEGYTARGPLDVFMLPLAAYDVLIVPDGPYAPKLFSTTSAQMSPLQIDQGTYVTGKAMDGAGAPVVGARVVLRSGVRPSTVGITDESGEFSLWTRAGTLSAVIAPPLSVGLPEALLVAGLSGITVDALANNRLTMTWATVTRGVLSVVVKTTDGGGPAAGARVRVESEAELRSVGSLKVENTPPSGLPQAATLVAPGAVRLDMDVDAMGLVRFPSLPVGPYKVTVVPPVAMPEAALTTTHVMLTTVGAMVTLPLSGRVMLGGTLLAAGGANGVRVIARDQSTGIVAAVASAITGDRGAYTLSVDPGDATLDRVYQLTADPPAGTVLARTVLGTVAVRALDKVAPDFTVAAAIPFTGTVSGDGRSVGGAVVQVFCLSAACLDPTSPIAETVTRGDGTFTVALPTSVLAP